MQNTMEQEATLEQAIELGLREDEFETIKEVIGRTPNFTETAIYSVMWSEHCSYKNSIYWLKKLPKDGPHMLVKAGEENAGLVDIGDGLGCVFKIESHNHPSALEPYQGAATGVGGILRDVFTMGARPIALLNSIHFGSPSHPKTKSLLNGVVSGIGGYGNCIGIPTVAGETKFDETYKQIQSIPNYNGKIWEYFEGWSCEDFLKQCVERNNLLNYHLIPPKTYRKLLQLVKDEQVHDCSHKNIMIEGICHFQHPNKNVLIL